MEGGSGGAPGGGAGGSGQGFFHRPRLPYYQKTQVYKHHHYLNRQSHGDGQPSNATNFDGKRMRKSVSRKTVDYNGTVLRLLERRIWQRDQRDQRWMQPDMSYLHEMGPPSSMKHNPINAVATKFVRMSTNKVRCPIFCAVWTPEGRRLVTGASSGEFTLWNGLTFNFETILQAHDYPVRTMTWSHNDLWLLTADHLGYVKYWQSNMNNVKMYQAHKDNPIRGASFCPTDSKFATCSDDGTVRIYDFLRCHEERIMRGHGADVRAVDWHPQKGLVVSGSKDNQQPIKLWDPRTGNSLATLHAHKNTVMGLKWNQNGNWLLTASRDHLCKLFDIRTMKEMYVFRGHKKEATAISWHPIHEDLFVSGGSDGSLLFWQIGNDKEVGAIESAHDSIVWSLAWHPLGHILCSGSNDHSIKFWARNRPGDRMRDRYNLNTLPIGTAEEMLEYDDDASAGPVVPGLGLEFGLPEHLKKEDEEEMEGLDTSIPGLDSSAEELARLKPQPQRKVPYAKPIPDEFQKAWDKLKAPGIAPQGAKGGPPHMNNKAPHERPPNDQRHHPPGQPPQAGMPHMEQRGPPHGPPQGPSHGPPPHEQQRGPPGRPQGPPHGPPPDAHHRPQQGPPQGQLPDPHHRPQQGGPHGHPPDPHRRPEEGPPHGQPPDPHHRQGPPHGQPSDTQHGQGPPPHGQGPPPRGQGPPPHGQPPRHPGPGMQNPRMPGGPGMRGPRPVLLGQPSEPHMPGNQPRPPHPRSEQEPPPPRNKGPPSLMSLNLDTPNREQSPADEDFRQGPPVDPAEGQDVDLRKQFGGGGGGDVDLRNRFRDQDHRNPQFPPGHREDNGRFSEDEDFRHQRSRDSPSGGPLHGDRMVVLILLWPAIQIYASSNMEDHLGESNLPWIRT
ncbi:pre-mRNA 3' end processing protein WDR33-like [Amphiura filiformis]|uniref:pre-mRNA 3' end processing protein WDR33-like n=1 Tax=Amphiura filiformis TaxID=82378 RepID=UPI003B213D3C